MEMYEQVCLELIRDTSTIDRRSEDFKQMIRKELLYAEMKFNEFIRRCGREPDLAFFQSELDVFNRERLPCFEGRKTEEEVSKTVFSEIYVELVRSTEEFRTLKLNPHDRKFVLSREEYKAKKAYEENNQIYRGYEDQVISKNVQFRTHILDKLLETFKEETKTLYKQYEAV